MMTNPFNPWDHRATQHGLVSGFPIYKSHPFEAQLHRDPEAKGQTLRINRTRHYEFKGFMPNNLVKRMTSLAHSCSSFVFLMLQAGYLATYTRGFDDAMDALRREFLPEEPFREIPIDLERPYDQVRMDFQQHVIGLIETIWGHANHAPEVEEKYRQEVLPLILRAARGERLSRPELCRLRLLSQLHCLQAEREVDLLGRYIKWFFPPATEATALEMKQLLRAGFDTLKSSEGYRAVLQEVKRHFDISPMRTSPGLLLDLFERQRMKQASRLPTFPGYIRRLSRIVKEALRTSRFDPYGYQTDPSELRPKLIDVGPKSLGVVRRVVQAVCAPIHLISRLFSAKAHNRQMLWLQAKQLKATRVTDAAETPAPNWRSQQVEAFETDAYAILCDLVEGQIARATCEGRLAALVTPRACPAGMAALLDRLQAWRQWISGDRARLQAAREIHFRSASEKSIQRDIKKGVKRLGENQRQGFKQQVLATHELLRDAMLCMKTVFMDLHTELCDRAEDGLGESARNRMYIEQEAFYKGLLPYDSWAAGRELPEAWRGIYERLPDREALEELFNCAKVNFPDLDVLAVLDYPLMYVLLQRLQSESQVGELHPAVLTWLQRLFELPGEDFMPFLELLRGPNYRRGLERICTLRPEGKSQASDVLVYCLQRCAV